MKIIVIILLIVQILILSPKITFAQSEVEANLLTIRTIVAPAMAMQQTTGGQFYQNQSLPPETAFGLTMLAIVFLATGIAILKIKTFSEHTERLLDHQKYTYAKQL